MNVHKAMWLEAHERLEKLIKKDTKRVPACVCHEFQAILNEIEQKHRGHIELRGSEDNLALYLAVDHERSHKNARNIQS